MQAEVNQRNAELLEDEVLAPLRGEDLSEVEFYVACKLLKEASQERPFSGEGLRLAITMRFPDEQANIDDREVKDIVRRLRKRCSFPILSSRKRGESGYWWCQSKDEMLGFIERFQKQPLDELHTLHEMVRRHFPELSGQLRLIE